MGSLKTARWALAVSVVSLCLSVATSMLVLLYVIQHDRELAARDLACATNVTRIGAQVESWRRETDELRKAVANFDGWVRITREQLAAEGGQ